MNFASTLSKQTGLPKNSLPKSYQIIGDIMLLKFMKIRSMNQKKNVASVLLNIFPYIKTICEIKKVSGELRKPKISKLAGNSTITTHKEHSILYKLDVSKIMFSKGNLNERSRLVKQIQNNETIIDMFAGIGYFSLGIAKNNQHKNLKIYAIEKNPTAFKYLKENIHLNKIKNIIPIKADCRIFHTKEKADRIIMGYFPNTENFLPTALSLLKNKGIIHFHNIYKENELWNKPKDDISKHINNFQILSKHKVKSIAPKIYHVVLDIEVS